MQQQLQLPLLPAYQSARWACIARQTCSSQRAHFPRISLLPNFIYDTYRNVASHPSPPFFCVQIAQSYNHFSSIFSERTVYLLICKRGKMDQVQLIPAIANSINFNESRYLLMKRFSLTQRTYFYCRSCQRQKICLYTSEKEEWSWSVTNYKRNREGLK